MTSARVILLFAATTLVSCNDPVHDDEVNALGPEAPGVSPGPTHRPGQPCLVCHGGQGPANLQLSIGGTVFLYPGSSQPATNAQIELEDATGSFWHLSTNVAGNFFVLQSAWSPTYPLGVPLVADPSGLPPDEMLSLDNRDGSCAACHASPEGTNSAGPIYLYTSQTDGG